MGVPLVSTVAAVVDIVADELIVDADARVALEAPSAATLLSILEEREEMRSGWLGEAAMGP